MFAFEILYKVKFDLTLTRGFNYYTDLIFEGVFTDNNPIFMGSLSGGGRYDELVVFFDKKKCNIQCVGFSIAMERISSIIGNLDIQTRDIDVFVPSVGKSEHFIVERMKIAKEL